MLREQAPTLSWEEARSLLGISEQATEAEVRAAYLQQVKLHPPDREPELFEKIRDAYEQLRDPNVRAKQILFGPDPHASLTTLLAGVSVRRKFVGTEPWMQVLKEKRP